MSKKLTTEEVQLRLNENNRNIVLIGECLGSGKKAKFSCTICGNEWETFVDSVLRNNSNCKICSKTLLTTEEINNRILPRNFKLLGEYTTYKEKQNFCCLTCGFIWKTHVNIINSKRACKVCSGFIYSTESVNKILKRKNMTLVGDYFGINDKHRFRHLECGHEWESSAYFSLHSDSSCPKCAKYGFNKENSAFLYYIKINRKNKNPVFKIGITNREVTKRFSKKELNSIEILKQKFFEIGNDAFITEQKIINEFSEFKYKGKKLLSTGNSEIFNIDISSFPNFNI